MGDLKRSTTMINILKVTNTFLLATCLCNAEEVENKVTKDQLLGLWKFNPQLTKQFAKRHAKLSDDELEFHLDLYKNKTIKYNTSGIVSISRPEVVFHDKTFEAYKAIFKYTVLDTSDQTVAIAFRKQGASKQLYNIVFESNNTFW